MEPKIVQRGQMILVGFGFYGDPFAESGGWTAENEIGRLWSRFMAYMGDHRAAVKHVKDEEVAYEVHVESPETTSKGFREVFVGLEVQHLADIPVQLLIKVLPATAYAVFTLKGEQIASDWSISVEDWLARSAYEQAGNYGIQRYDQRFLGVDNLETSELDVYIPVKSRTDGSSNRDL